jgi:Domain of unknown function (DUF5122) beta-propeller
MHWRPLGVSLSTLLLAGLSCAQPVASPSQTASPGSKATPATSPTHLAGDLWYLTRGGAKADQGWGVAVDEAGDVYFATHQQAAGQLFSDMVIYRFTPDGHEVWQARWGGAFMEKAFIVTVSEGVAYVGGVSYASANLTDSDMAVIALDAGDGHLLWDFTWGQGFGYEEVDGLVVDGDALYVSGWTTSASTGNDVAVLKLSRSGTLIWESVWGSPDWDQGDGQMVVDQDSIFVAGRYGAKNILLGGQGLLVRFSKDSGAYQEHTTWGGPVGTDALGLTSDGTSLFAVGLTVDEGSGGQIFVRKYDKHLNLIWASLWGGPKSESARAVAVDRQGYIVVAGETGSSGAGGLDLALLRFDPQGDLVWSRVWGGAENEGALGLALDGDAAYIAASTHSFGSGQDDALLLKVDPMAGVFPAP